jgi:hypothetical protein
MKQNVTYHGLKAKQIRLLETALEAGFHRNITAICSDAGVSRVTFYRWMDDPQFRDAWEGLWKRMAARHLPSAVSAIVAKAQKGDVSASRLLAEMAGVLKQQVEQTGTQRIEIEYTNNWRNIYEADTPAAASGAGARDAEGEAI